MKKTIITAFSCLLAGIGFAQKAVLQEGKSATLKDSRTQNTYVLDTSHIYISAYNSKGKELWKSYTTVCNFCRECGPVKITAIELRKSAVAKNEEERVLYVEHCRCEGYFKLATGKYYEIGCD